MDLFVGKTGSLLCPVSAILSYLCVRGMENCPLFMFEDGRVLTRQRFVAVVKEGLQRAGTDSSKYNFWQFLNWCRYYSCCQGIGRQHHQDLGKMGERGIPAVCEDSS